MYLNKNSSREYILTYIKYFPLYFLREFSHEPWAQPYLDEVAKESARKNPFHFLYFSYKYWAEPYIDEAAKRSIKKDSVNFLRYYSDKPWTEPYIDEAVKEVTKKYPQYFLEKLADRFPHHINLALFALGSKNGSV